MSDSKITALGELASVDIAAADMLPVVDVSDTSMAVTGTTKKFSWTSIKAALKTYFDTLYPTGSGMSTGTNTGDNSANSLYSGLVTNATHTGDVTGAIALTITAKAVTLAKMDDMATASLIYRKTTAAGAPEVNTLAVLKTDLGSMPASDVSAWAKSGTKPSYTASEVGADAAMTAASQAEMEAGTETALRSMTPQRVKQAITALAPLTPEIVTPTNTSPADAATGQGETPTLTGSTFYSNYGATHANIQVQVSTSSNFASPLYSSGDQAGSVSFVLPAGQLSVNTTYYWRVRYKNSRGTYSDWSTPTTFQTAAMFNSYIATPAATPSFGASFEGGFYTGLVWNELIESSTSTAIGTGSKTFTVSASAAYAYSGQALEVRSRANPANKMIGTVTGSSLTTLIVNVTSVGGSGTFTDWSVMSRYRVIVAPKSSGENSSIAFKNANTAAPSACGTLTEGKKATDAMVAADTSTVYPAAWWCHNLSIGGKTDWYLPARDELELAWRNLKPTTDANYTTADRSTGATPNYMNLGSYGDTAATHGLNNNSSPTGAAYTSGSPAQTSVSAFQTGNAEAFAYGSYYYWSASGYSTTSAWYQFWTSGLPGVQTNFSKSYACYVRAVRRSII